ncbi:hypothetical protein ACFQMH_31555 [Streptomyces viridiviolaceus]|uniref:Uncharacterized protein n=1 Tax=Streptomyces viridiviolaceus TaxID=68282 RepID=A0ABW2E7L1_9ACTN|nr:hypothetical protein [Streptomyces viridiviolaceus]
MDLSQRIVSFRSVSRPDVALEGLGEELPDLDGPVPSAQGADPRADLRSCEEHGGAGGHAWL